MAGAAGTGGQILVVPFNQYTINAFGWSEAIVIMSVVMVVIIPLAYVLKGKTEDHSVGREQAASLLQVLDRARKHSGYLYLTAGFYVCGFHVMFIMAHLPNYLSVLEMPEWLPGTAISIIGMTNLVGTFMFGWLGDKYSKKYLLSILYFLRSIVIAGFIIFPISEYSVLAFSFFI